jgi:hypothetical protein
LYAVEWIPPSDYRDAPGPIRALSRRTEARSCDEAEPIVDSAYRFLPTLVLAVMFVLSAAAFDVWDGAGLAAGSGLGGGGSTTVRGIVSWCVMCASIPSGSRSQRRLVGARSGRRNELGERRLD